MELTENPARLSDSALRLKISTLEYARTNAKTAELADSWALKERIFKEEAEKRGMTMQHIYPITHIVWEDREKYAGFLKTETTPFLKTMLEFYESGREALEGADTMISLIKKELEKREK